MLIELNEEQVKLLKETVESLSIYAALNNPINITDTCPHCGTTEMLCGHGGSGCSHETENTDEEE